jgi:hypothetical protein
MGEATYLKVAFMWQICGGVVTTRKRQNNDLPSAINKRIKEYHDIISRVAELDSRLDVDFIRFVIAPQGYGMFFWKSYCPTDNRDKKKNKRMKLSPFTVLDTLKCLENDCTINAYPEPFIKSLSNAIICLKN